MGVILLAITAALVSALGFVEPARADDATGAPADAAVTSEGDPSTAEQPTAATSGSEEPATPDPEPAPQPEPPPDSTDPAPDMPASGDPPSDSTEPGPSEEPAGEVVALEPEPEPEPAIESCAEESGAEGAQTGACEAAGESTPAAESPQAACDADAATAASSACPEQAQSPVAPATGTPAAQPAAQPPAAPVVLVVSLAPNETATVPAVAETVADLELAPPAAEAGVAAHGVASFTAAPPVELATAPVRVTRLTGGPFLVAPAAAWPAVSLQPLSPAAMTYLESVSGTIAPAAMRQGARAGPREVDGHVKAATAEVESTPPSVADGPLGPLDDQGPGASGGSAGGAPGGAASSRYFAIATTPLRFGFPSAFAYAPLPSSLPEGALEAAPTTRPG